MPLKTYSRGLLLWVDDSLEGHALPQDLWSALFGNQSDRVYRLLDLSFEVATSYEVAIEKLSRFKSCDEVGTFLFCVANLSLPPRRGMAPALKYGVALAKELRALGMTFSFLSASTDGTSILAPARLNTVPYHVKDSGSNWRLPKSLAFDVLSALRRRISWVLVEDTVRVMHTEPHPRASSRTMEEAFRYFPYFGPYREFVERCEHSQVEEFRPTIAVRAPRKHCDEFVQQALSIMLYPRLLPKPEAVRVYYGHAHEGKYLDLLKRSVVRNDADAASVIRVTPEFTTSDQLVQAMDSLGIRAGKTILVLPSDETAYQYIELLRRRNITAIEELPQIQLDDLGQREELFRQSCTMAFHLWMRQHISGEPVRLEKGSLIHPELLINPIHWSALLEAPDIPEELSDPFQIAKKVNQILRGMNRAQRTSIQYAVEKGHPIPYRLLLRVGHDMLIRSNFKDEFPIWVERTLDAWLKSSWQCPYGIQKYDLNNTRSCAENGLATGDRECWQDGCYEVLVGILGEHLKYDRIRDSRTPRQQSLQRVGRFVDALGGAELLAGNISSLDWDKLALMRWPHGEYPLPSAVLRRLREVQRSLWIQPERLDIAAALPAGRQRYRLLSSMADQYGAVLAWSNSVAENLPLGWQRSIGYLTEVIAEHRIASEWQSHPEEVWYAFLTLLCNGGPMMFIADRLVHGTLVKGARDAAADYLSSVSGYGKILERLRVSRDRRVGRYLVPSLKSSKLDSDLVRLNQVGSYLSAIEEHMGDEGQDRLQELETAARAMILAAGDAAGAMYDPNTGGAIQNALSELVADPKMNLTTGNGWYLEGFTDKSEEFFRCGDVPSLFSTKADYLWQALDALLCLENVTRIYRYYDGYHFLAALNELRVSYKDSKSPNVSLAVVETLADLYVSSIQGLVAQLAWCVEASGQKDRADAIRPPDVAVRVLEGVALPSVEELSTVARVEVGEKGWEVFTLGIPGKSTVNKLCYQDGGNTIQWQGE